MADRYEDNDYPDDDRTLVVSPAGLGAVLPASARRLKGEALEAYAVLMREGLEVAEREQRIQYLLVPAARSLGVSWSLIGAAVGMTSEGARLRYGDQRGD
jgi:hypothetical protein